MMNSTSPIKEHEQEGSDTDDGYQETVLGLSANRCGFRLFCFQWRRTNDRETRHLLRQEGEQHEETWLVNKLKRVKEVSEILAGPKWKNFIRRFGKYFNKKNRRTQFQYDLQSYALNFDHGVDEEDDNLSLGFSSRFAVPFSGEGRAG